MFKSRYQGKKPQFDACEEYDDLIRDKEIKG